MVQLTTDDLFRILQPTSFFRGQTTQFHGIACHSAQASPGIVFFALPSKKKGPEGFIDISLHKGVTAIVAHEDIVMEKRAIFSHVTFFGVPNIRLALTKAAHFLFPRTPPFLAAVTGTNGKTSIVNFTRQLLQKLGHKAMSIGTLGVTGIQDARDDYPLAPLTTLEPLELYPLLNSATSEGITHAIMEASSHGLHQRRLDGLKFHVGVFSNFSHDHLDYHLNLRTYWLNKTRLFKELMHVEGIAIFHTSLMHSHELSEICRRNGLTHWTYGPEGDAFIQKITCKDHRQDVTFVAFEKKYQFTLPLLGAFQAENALAALLTVHASGVPIKDILPFMAHLQTAPGRLEHLGSAPNGGDVYVDYAHTPDALETLLKHTRENLEGELYVIFGCGGDRDTTKRARMGEIAAQFAHHVVVTDDNPRMEDPASIRRTIMQGAPKATDFPGRAEAITHTIAHLKKGDRLVIAGKGHECYQIIGHHSLPLSDKNVALKAMRKQEAS